MLEITIPMPGLSLNNSHMVLKRGGRIKKAETRAYEEDFRKHLIPFKDEMAAFVERFDPVRMGVEVEYEFFFPAENFYTKRGGLNLKKVPDLDNLLKIPTDLLFENLFNDAYILQVTANKYPTNKQPFIIIRVETMPLPEVGAYDY